MLFKYQKFACPVVEVELDSFKDLLEYLNYSLYLNDKEEEFANLYDYFEDVEDIEYYKNLINNLKGESLLHLRNCAGDTKIIGFDSYDALLKNEDFLFEVLDLHFLEIDGVSYLAYKKAKISNNFTNYFTY